MSEPRLPVIAFTVLLTDLAEEFKVTRYGLGKRAAELGIDVRRRAWFAKMYDKTKRLYVTPEGAALLRADNLTRVRPIETHGHWPRVEEAAAALGLGVNSFRQRRMTKTIQVEAFMLSGIEACHFVYNPDDLRREAARLGVKPRSIPAGSLTTAQAGKMFHVTAGTLRSWQRRGLTRHLTVSGRAYWWPADIQAFKQARKAGKTGEGVHHDEEAA